MNVYQLTFNVLANQAAMFNNKLVFEAVSLDSFFNSFVMILIYKCVSNSSFSSPCASNM